MGTLADILYTTVDGSFAIDSRQRIIYWDQGCEELLGYSEHWALGRPCCSVLQGCHPVSGRRWCRQQCDVSKLPVSEAPKSFLVRVKDSTGQGVNLSVDIILLPSSCKKNWHIMHLLHRSSHTDVLGLMDHSQRKPKESKQVIPDRVNQTRLTPRETQVLSLMAEGVASRTISDRLHISQTTVRNHIQHIQKKLAVHSKTEAVAYAYRHKFL
ncbi:MAG: LuxR C-terminal-related transcriptional regulator [Gammaproteobacteria bacterium]|nr:LuxR C-terminal-related transcriptional regulator [Gammaproteobacteria bacterium]MDH5802536.1 LuxR C-terminal-related transcriptional regulator [Gammaproteobacteria bacterium]